MHLTLSSLQINIYFYKPPIGIYIGGLLQSTSEGLREKNNHKLSKDLGKALADAKD